MEMMLTVQDLTKRYHDFKALDHFSMHVEKRRHLRLCRPQRRRQNDADPHDLHLRSPSLGSYTLMGYGHNDPQIVQARRRMGAVIETPALYFAAQRSGQSGGSDAHAGIGRQNGNR